MTPRSFTGSALKAFEGDSSDIGVPSVLKLVEADGQLHTGAGTSD